MSKTRTFVLPLMALLFVLGSSLSFGRSAATQSQQVNSASVTHSDAQSQPPNSASITPSDEGIGNSIDKKPNWGYRDERETARRNSDPAHEWRTNPEKPRDTANQKSWSPVHPGIERVQRVLNSPRAVKVLARCRAQGMFELTDEAFVISDLSPVPGGNYLASERKLGSASRYLAIPMTNPGGNKFATTMLYREEDGNVIAITVDTETGDLVEAISSEDGPEDGPELIKFDKKKWVDCFTTTCGPCIAGCAFTGPFWLKCAGACCGVAAAVCAYVAIEK